MEKRRKASDHVTILALAVGISALTGAAAGVSTSVLLGGFAVSDVFSRFVAGKPVPPASQVSDLEEENATIAATAEVSPSVVSIIERQGPADIGGGTGFFVSPDGLILTNRHVVQDANATYVVVTNDGAELPATVVATDPFLDVAVVRVQGSGYPAATLGNSDRLKIGQTVIAIGNTLSAFRNTVTRGVVSGLDRRVIAGDDTGSDELIQRAIQTDASINPGNSGGPLLTLTGEVIGMNTALSQDAQGVGFAIPVNDLKRAVGDVVAYGRIIHAWLGVRYVPLTAEIATARKLPVKDGAWIEPNADGTSPIASGSPADAAGLKVGDIIVSVNGQALTGDNDLSYVISSYRPGDTVLLRVVRGEERFDLSVTLAEYVPPKPPAAKP
jgi:serine protease Do